MRLVYLSPLPWASFAQRPHKLVEWFHAQTGGDVLWVDPYPTRLPAWSDLGRIAAGSQDGGATAIPQWLKVLKPSSLPIEPLPGSGLLNALFWKKLLREIDIFAGRDATVVGIGKPSVLALKLLSRNATAMSFYDAMDDFPAFYTGISRMAMASREQLLASRVHQVFASSTKLLERWHGDKQNVSLVHNGLSAGMLPAFVQRKNRDSPKVLGYVGTIGEWFDWDWLLALAQARAADRIRLIGPVFAQLPTALPGNVELLPPCDHASALAAMQDFDVGLIPFKINPLTASVDPIKFYEYRGLGLPVVSTRFGEMALRTGVTGTYLSDGPNDVTLPVEAALAYRPDEVEIQEFRTANSWEARFESINILQ
jgi:hypothetical protein